jgi:hypothetical protein
MPGAVAGVWRVVAAREVAACRFQALWLLRSEDGQAVIFREVLVLLEVQRGGGSTLKWVWLTKPSVASGAP